MKNRLNLDFSIPDQKGRKIFTENYLKKYFPKGDLTDREIETIANYLLYGKNEDGLNAVDRKEIQITTRYGTWDRKNVESLDGLLENPSFSENQIKPANAPVYKTPKTVFSREENKHIPELYDLWRRIDITDLTINFYDLACGKRIKPPRQELLDRLSAEDIAYCEKRAAEIKPYLYYKLRHLLVELRTEQYTIRDSYVTPIASRAPHRAEVFKSEPSQFERDIPVLPLGLWNSTDLAQEIFQPVSENSFLSENIGKISYFYYSQKELADNPKILDFTNLEHIYEIFLLSGDLESDISEDPESLIPFLLRTVDFYTSMAELDEAQLYILDLKKERKKNQDVADLVNKKFNRTYTSNYISTIFRQQICKRVAEAAQYHALLIENLAFPENFKECNRCNSLLLRDTRNFVRKARAADGLSNRCKKCDKLDRQNKKEIGGKHETK